MNKTPAPIIKIALPGASGRMGRMITHAAQQNDRVTIVSATDLPLSEFVGADLGSINNLNENGVKIGTTPNDLIAPSPDVILDFTAPDASINHAIIAAEKKIPIVIGTTGFADALIKNLKQMAQETAIVWCANTSVGVTMLEQLVEETARALGQTWDIEITETHHKHKVDAPSGTALALGDAAARGRGVALKDVAVHARHGITGPREDGTIGFAAMRGGDVVGEHSVIFYGQSERIEITHRAFDRMVFARGAIRAAIWATSAAPGLYSMKDVLK